MPKPPNSIRLVPEEPDSDEIVELAESEGWEETERSFSEVLQWTVPDADAQVSWVDDSTTGVEFIVIEGDDRKAAAATIEKTIDVLQPKDFESYLSRFGGVQWEGTALQAVALAAPDKPDKDVVKLVKRYLSHDRAVLRQVALLAAGITGWQDFVKPIEEMRDDSDEDVRRGVEPALQALREAA
jgi:hypothetical protein